MRIRCVRSQICGEDLQIFYSLENKNAATTISNLEGNKRGLGNCFCKIYIQVRVYDAPINVKTAPTKYLEVFSATHRAKWVLGILPGN